MDNEHSDETITAQPQTRNQERHITNKGENSDLHTDNFNNVDLRDNLNGGRPSLGNISMDSDEIAMQHQCAFVWFLGRMFADGDDPRWYYPWDKEGICRCCILGTMWMSICAVFPCSLCIPSCRSIICCVQEGRWKGTCCEKCLYPEHHKDVEKDNENRQEE